VQALDDGGRVDQVAAAERTQQVLVHVVDATSSSPVARPLGRHVDVLSAAAAGCGRGLHHAPASLTGLAASYNIKVYADITD